LAYSGVFNTSRSNLLQVTGNYSSCTNVFTEMCYLISALFLPGGYDHFLAAHWEDYADVPLSLFISDSWRVLCEHKDFLPDRLQRILPFMFSEWLLSYSDLRGIAAVLHRISCFRVKRANPLEEGAEALSRHYGGLYGDFRKFFPELLAFSEIRARLDNNVMD
jgi:acyl carrier protein phosphodiesterase